MLTCKSCVVLSCVDKECDSGIESIDYDSMFLGAARKKDQRGTMVQRLLALERLGHLSPLKAKDYLTPLNLSVEIDQASGLALGKCSVLIKWITLPMPIILSLANIDVSASHP
jgi:hypothetical protein